MQIVTIDAKTWDVMRSDSAFGLTAHLNRLRDGNDPTPRTPLFKHYSVDEVQAMWSNIMESYAGSFPDLIEYEFTRWSKFGPQGGFAPLNERWESLRAYFTRLTDAPIRQSSQYQTLIKRTREVLFSKHSLRALTPEQVLTRDFEEDKLDTNSGLPDFSRRSNPLVQQRAVEDAKSGLWKQYPAILGSRSSRGKQRFIFMFPMSTNLVEKQYVVPIMDAIRQKKVLSFAAWEGFDAVERAFHEQSAFDAAFLASMDYTGMDQTMGEEQMLIVYDVLAPVFQPQFRAGLKESLLHAVSIPILYAHKRMLTGKHGLASGSGWTNLSESIMSQFVHEYIRIQVPLKGDQLLGDDGAMTFDKVYDFAQLIEEASGACGLVANADKQHISELWLTYLQRFFHKDILIPGGDMVAGSYPTVLALNSAMNPERFHSPEKWNERMETLRWIMILENCNHSPLFHDIIKFFMKGDKFRLGLDIPGWLTTGIVEDHKSAKAIKGFVPTYTTSHREKGILDFDTVKYLKTLR